MINLSKIYFLVAKLLAAHEINATLRLIEKYDIRFDNTVILIKFEDCIDSCKYICGFSCENILISLAGDAYNNIDEIEVWMADGKNISCLPEAELFSKDSIVHI